MVQYMVDSGKVTGGQQTDLQQTDLEWVAGLVLLSRCLWILLARHSGQQHHSPLQSMRLVVESLGTTALLYYDRLWNRWKVC